MVTKEPGTVGAENHEPGHSFVGMLLPLHDASNAMSISPRRTLRSYPLHRA